MHFVIISFSYHQLPKRHLKNVRTNKKKKIKHRNKIIHNIQTHDIRTAMKFTKRDKTFVHILSSNFHIMYETKKQLQAVNEFVSSAKIKHMLDTYASQQLEFEGTRHKHLSSIPTKIHFTVQERTLNFSLVMSTVKSPFHVTYS